jgi:hypothetical protein
MPKAMPEGHSTGPSPNPIRTHCRKKGHKNNLLRSIDLIKTPPNPAFHQTPPLPPEPPPDPIRTPMRDQSNAIRDQVSFKQQEKHIRDFWNHLCQHYNLNKSGLVKFLIQKEHQNLQTPINPK